jgi:LruC domain-containing protein
MTINAIAYKTGLDDSEVVSGDYSIILSSSSDYDGDGVADDEDDYPTDPALAFNNYYPGIGYGSVAFEDNWPFKADYDMNDMVVDYRFNQITNANNLVVQLNAKLVVRAMGASFHNGFGIELPVTPAQVKSCVVNLKSGKLISMGSIVSIDPVTGLELNQNNAVVILFDDGFKILPPNGGIGVNTTPTLPFVVPDTLLMTVIFTQPVSPDVLKSQIFNPFIFTNQNRGYEIHLPDYPPTKLANMSLFNTGEDKSDPANGKYYKTANNLPWALNIYEGYQYPNEKVSILDAYKHFAEWAGSGGALFPDWYKDLPGYRNASNIYIQH